MSGARRARIRADVLLVSRGLAASREKAQALVLAGEVFASGQAIKKPGELLAHDADLAVVPRRRFVSRGGDKLERALIALGDALPPLAGRSVVDVGASTGGFSDCLLQRGVAHVYAVDVGKGQLDGKLASDPRVTVRDKTNARELTRESFDRAIDLVVVDASFIGLGKLAPAIASFLAPGGWLIALVKPQFEVGRAEAKRARGVIRDAQLREGAIDEAVRALVGAGFEPCGRVDSEVPGPKGNREHFVLARRGPAP